MGYEDEKAGNFLLEGERELWRGRQWLLTNMHIEEIAGRNDTLGPPYWVDLTPGFLGDRNHVQSIMDKVWVDAADFLEAYRRGCEWLGVEAIDFDQAAPKSPADTMIERVIAERAAPSNVVDFETARRRHSDWRSIGAAARSITTPDGAA